MGMLELHCVTAPTFKVYSMRHVALARGVNQETIVGLTEILEDSK